LETGGISMSVPAHKVVGDKGKPGQTKGDITLADYVERIKAREQPKKRLSFEEWFNLSYQSGSCNENDYDLTKVCWNASRENM
jgi:hypothetical protein